MKKGKVKRGLAAPLTRLRVSTGLLNASTREPWHFSGVIMGTLDEMGDARWVARNNVARNRASLSFCRPFAAQSRAC